MGHESAFLDLALLAAILLTLAARAAAQTPIALQDSNWFDLRDVSSMTLLLIIPPADRFLDPRMGVDGNWSTVGLQIGSSAHKVNILVSTALSELWVVGPGGCLISMLDPSASLTIPLSYLSPLYPDRRRLMPKLR